MRGLLTTACLVARVWAYTFPTGPFHPEEEGGPSAAVVSFYIPFNAHSIQTGKSFGPVDFNLRFEVFPSEHACGYANVKIDGMELLQNIEGEFSRGASGFTTRSGLTIIGSWKFRCIQINGEDVKMLMKFSVVQVDGVNVRNVGFAATFEQTGTTEITLIDKNIFLERPDELIANPDFEQYLLDETQGFLNFREKNIEDRIEELENFYKTIDYLQRKIDATERIIGLAYPEFLAPQTLAECKSLRCAMSIIFKNAKKTCHRVLSHNKEQFQEEISVGEKLRSPPRWRRPHGKPGNHTCGSPKHGNHSHPHPPYHGPHPPPWRRPHGRRPDFPHGRIPICRMPPHHGPPHHGPPHHGPPRDGPPHHGGTPHDRRPHNGPPPALGPLVAAQKKACGPKFLITSVHPPIPVLPIRVEVDPTPFHDGPHTSTDFNRHAKISPDLHRYSGRPHNPHHTHSPSTTQIFLVSSIIFAVLLFTHRRRRNPAAYLARLAAREERKQRRAARRAAFRRAVARVVVRIFPRKGRLLLGDDEGGLDEKSEEKLLSMEEGTARCSEILVGEEIVELRNVVQVVGEIVDAEAVGRVSEDLPRYEPSVGTESEDGSGRVVDGFLYTPSTTVYTPSESSDD